ncbi:MAG: nucleotidyltransferase family protein, partial [Gemmatimonadetes bacterium]|nr:nucleotidyltransferase family protein [Gemmatimonadota bacterium]
MREGSVWAILPAAGRGIRYGGPKLLAMLEGRPLLEHVLSVLVEARESGAIAGGVVVVRAGDTAIVSMARDAGMHWVESRQPSAGLAHSLELGVTWLEGDALHPRPAAAVIVPGDQPRVRARVLSEVVQRWREGAAAAVRPRYREEPHVPGHPVVLDRSVWGHVSRLRGDAGFGQLLRRRPDW